EARLRAAGFGPEQFTAVRSNFAGLPNVLANASLTGVGCLVADLGAFSMRLDHPDARFATKAAVPLDMRMNPQRGFSASALAEKTSPDALAKLLAENVDEPRASQLADAIAGRRFITTRELADAIQAASPGLKRDDLDLTVRRVFQALRIAVNDE